MRIWPERIFLGVGTAEAGSAERSRTVVDDVRELAADLAASGAEREAVAAGDQGWSGAQRGGVGGAVSGSVAVFVWAVELSRGESIIGAQDRFRSDRN